MEFKIKVTKEDIKELIQKRFENLDIGKSYLIEVEIKNMYGQIEAEVTLIDADRVPDEIED